ncbi:MAG: HEPN family nuclease [Dorea sp.]
MARYNTEHYLASFAKRTAENLEFVNVNAKESGLFEVTQLINSLLGLIVIPVEAYKCTKNDAINDNKLKELSKDDFECIDKLLDTCQKEKRLFCDYGNWNGERNDRVSVSKFIIHLRNALAHGGNNGIHFYPMQESEKIEEVIFYDNDKSWHKNNIHEFCVKLSIEEIQNLVKAISNLYCKFEDKDEEIGSKKEKYEKDIGCLEYLMKNGRKDRNSVAFEFKSNDSN